MGKHLEFSPDTKLKTMQVAVNRKKIVFSPDPSRVIARFLQLSDDRSADIIRKVLAMPEKEVNIAMSQLLRGYSRRHRNISRIFEKHFNKLAPVFDKIEVNEEDLSPAQKALIAFLFYDGVLDWNRRHFSILLW